jgi:arylsulfatase A-like enzyme
MKQHFVFCLLIAMIMAGCRDQGPKRPNIFLINVDDMGWKDVGFMGTEYYETPNIDQLAHEGMIFTNGYAAAANCAPSRACMMTGQWATRHGIYTVASSERGASRHRKLIPTVNTTTLGKEYTTIAEVLRTHGYSTCQAGKWHLSNDATEYGFDLSIGGGHNGHPRSYYPPYGNVDLEAPDSTNLTDLIAGKAIQFLDSVNQPFFLYYSPYAVHTPIQPIPDLLSKYRQKSGSNGQQNADYATMVENLDRNIGLLIDALRSRALLDNTLIIFTSDNGGLYGITKQLPLRAGKGSYYEGGIREPFFFTWKGNIPKGSISDIPITNIDLFPTMLDILGVKNAEFDFDGQSILPILNGKITDFDRPLFWHFPIYLQAYNVHDNENRDSLFRTRPGSVVRFQNWKLHYYFEDDGMELYNLEEDIGERNNLIQKNPAKAEELLNLLKDWWDETNAPIPTERNPEYLGE